MIRSRDEDLRERATIAEGLAEPLRMRAETGRAEKERLVARPRELGVES